MEPGAGKLRTRKGRTSMKNLSLAVVIMTLLLGSQLFAAPIQLGASVQLTGQFANTGRYYGDAYQFAVEKINAAGGVKIGNAREKLNLKILDNQSDVNLSVRQY